MYWLRSLFEINSVQDLELLIRIYAGVSGELYVTGMDDEKILDIEWCKEPFAKLLTAYHTSNGLLTLKEKLTFPFKIVSRLVGPQSLLAVAPVLKKVDYATYDQENKDLSNYGYLFHPNNEARRDLVLDWTTSIDKAVSYEMKRSNDMGMMFNHPEELLTTNELILAARLSKYATHVYIGENGIIASNFECTYLTWFPAKTMYQDNDKCTSLMFDKDDGHYSPFGEVGNAYSYMTECFNKWKNNNYEGKLSDYCQEYAEHFN